MQLHLRTRCRPNGTSHYWPAACCALVGYVAYASVTDTDRRWQTPSTITSLAFLQYVYCVGGSVITNFISFYFLLSPSYVPFLPLPACQQEWVGRTTNRRQNETLTTLSDYVNIMPVDPSVFRYHSSLQACSIIKTGGGLLQIIPLVSFRKKSGSITSPTL